MGRSGIGPQRPMGPFRGSLRGPTAPHLALETWPVGFVYLFGGSDRSCWGRPGHRPGTALGVESHCGFSCIPPSNMRADIEADMLSQGLFLPPE